MTEVNSIKEFESPYGNWGNWSQISSDYSCPLFANSKPTAASATGIPNMPAYYGGFDTFNLDGDSLQTMMKTIDWGQVCDMQQKYMAAIQERMKAAYANMFQQGGGSSVSGDANFDVRTPYKGTAEDLNKNLKGVLAGKGAKLLELQNKYGINAAFLAALVNSESGYGSSNGAKTKNNVAGIMSSKGGLATFSSVDECLESLAENLSKNYIGQGLCTIADIQKKYCPVGASNDPTGLNKNWLGTVSQLTAKYDVA